MTALDGVPLVPIEALCKDMGYTFRVSDNTLQIETYQKDYLANIPTPESGLYEFNYPGYNDGWDSGNTTLLTSDGFLRAETFAEGEKTRRFGKSLKRRLQQRSTPRSNCVCVIVTKQIRRFRCRCFS